MHEVRPSPLPRDYWPLIRVAILIVGMAVQAHWSLGLADLWTALPGLAVKILGTFAGLALISLTLAMLYALIWLLPLMLLIHLDAWLYAGIIWILHCLLMLRDGLLLRTLALGFELSILSLGLAWTIGP